ICPAGPPKVCSEMRNHAPVASRSDTTSCRAVGIAATGRVESTRLTPQGWRIMPTAAHRTVAVASLAAHRRLPFLRGEPVAHPGFGEQVPRSSRIFFELPPQLTHVDAQITRIR